MQVQSCAPTPMRCYFSFGIADRAAKRRTTLPVPRRAPIVSFRPNPSTTSTVESGDRRCRGSSADRAVRPPASPAAAVGRVAPLQLQHVAGLPFARPGTSTSQTPAHAALPSATSSTKPANPSRSHRAAMRFRLRTARIQAGAVGEQFHDAALPVVDPRQIEPVADRQSGRRDQLAAAIDSDTPDPATKVGALVVERLVARHHPGGEAACRRPHASTCQAWPWPFIWHDLVLKVDEIGPLLLLVGVEEQVDPLARQQFVRVRRRRRDGDRSSPTAARGLCTSRPCPHCCTSACHVLRGRICRQTYQPRVWPMPPGRPKRRGWTRDGRLLRRDRQSPRSPSGLSRGGRRSP